MTDAVLDSSAILAVLNGEAGADSVMTWLGRSSVSAVNYAEVVTKLVEGGSSRFDARESIMSLGVVISDFDQGLAERTGELRSLTRHKGLSLGDRACLALAEREKVPVVTTDRNWRDVLPSLDIQVVR